MDKDLEYFMNLNYKMEIAEDDESGYVLSYPELTGCITVAENLEDGIRNLKDARREWIIACLEDGTVIPSPNSEEDYSGNYSLRMPKSLHRDISLKAKKEGISLNQYCVYVLSKEIGKNDLKSG